MKSYLAIQFSSEGIRPSEVAERLHLLGFRPTAGNYDFVYDWGQSGKVKDAVWFADKIYQELAGCNVTFRLETVGAENEEAPDASLPNEDVITSKKPKY